MTDIENGYYINKQGTIVNVTGLALNVTSGTEQVMAKYQYRGKDTVELVQEINEFKSQYKKHATGVDYGSQPDQTGYYRQEG